MATRKKVVRNGGLRLGPVLSFRGAAAGVWNVSILMAGTSDAPPSIEMEGIAKPAVTELDTVTIPSGALRSWRFDCAIVQMGSEQRITYSFADEGDKKKWTFIVPPLGVAPRMAYGSCNGFSSLKLLKSTKDPNGLWKDVATKHAKAPFHLLLLGGDQVYSDAIWDELPALGDWVSIPMEQRIKVDPSDRLKREIETYYLQLYPRRWTQPEPSDMLGSIPTVMMWDDHDIFDGWGSYPKDLQSCRVYDALFRAARRAFSLYQHQLAPNEPHPLAIPGQKSFSLGFRVGPVAIVALDMRSERSNAQVISQESWKAIFSWMDSLPSTDESGDAPRHLFILSSIPVVYPDFQLLEKTLGLFPGSQNLEDDLRDHWTSPPHRQERLRLIHRLLAFSEAKKCRVTVLSGDVHVGSVGVVRSERTAAGRLTEKTLNQLTSSGIVHPAPPGVALFFLEHVFDKVSNDDSGVTSGMIEIPGTHHYFIGARNWLALQPDHEHRYWANWHVEDQEYPYTKVVHPFGFEMPGPKLPQETLVFDAPPP